MKNDERVIFGEIEVPASVADVWSAWTTHSGITSFFAPACRVELRPGGPYEIYFTPESPPGERGAEGTRVLAFQPEKMLAFTWSAPPHLPDVRRQRTSVVVRLRRCGEGRTRVTLTHSGWGEGGEWDLAFDYFSRAWREVVLPRLRRRFDTGPIDWMGELGAPVPYVEMDGYHAEPVDTSSPESMIRGMARRALEVPMVKIAQGETGQYIEDLLYVVEQWHGDCAIIAGHPGCKWISSAYGLIRDACRERNVPVLLYDVDLVDFRVVSAEESRTRIGEFLQMVLEQRN